MLSATSVHRWPIGSLARPGLREASTRVGFIDLWRRRKRQAFSVCHPIGKYFTDGWPTSPDTHRCPQISEDPCRYPMRTDILRYRRISEDTSGYLKMAANIFGCLKMSSTSSISGHSNIFTRAMYSEQSGYQVITCRSVYSSASTRVPSGPGRC